MRRGRFSNEQIAQVLAEHRSGLSAAEVCRKHQITPKTFYTWKSKFGEMQATEVKRMKEMQEQITRLERIVAKQAVELQAAQEIIRGKW